MFTSAILLVLATTVHADVVLRSGEGSITLMKSHAWTLSRLDYRGHQLVDAPLSSQGTVLLEESGLWAGSGHGYETVESVELRVDGVEVAIVDGREYSGDTFSFTRATTLGNTYRLRSVIEYDGSSLAESVRLVRTRSDVKVTLMYGFLGSRVNNLDSFVTLDGEQGVLATGVVREDNVTQTDLGKAETVLLYDAVTGVGIASRFEAEDGITPQNQLFDRVNDNKHYIRLVALEGFGQSGDVYSLRQALTFHQASVDQWTSGTVAIPEPASLMLVLSLSLPLLTRRRAH